MSLLGHLRALNQLDLADLDLENVGNWPLVLKSILLGVLYSLIVVAGFYFHVQALQQRLANTEQQEETLRQEFEQKAFEAANLDIYRAQLTEMTLRFGELVAQLPSQTE
ncbi:MAG: type 4a pilus biogenesis protein PilO, partial [Luminiphilus sp.]|nr:type 4a pilus biogenesis protein PilO [Luminiphilus sp.]